MRTTYYYGNLKVQLDAIKAHSQLLDMESQAKGLNLIHDPTQAIKTCVKRYKKFYGLTSKYDGNGTFESTNSSRGDR